jgi:hypothetical protein
MTRCFNDPQMEVVAWTPAWCHDAVLAGGFQLRRISAGRTPIKCDRLTLNLMSPVVVGAGTAATGLAGMEHHGS